MTLKVAHELSVDAAKALILKSLREARLILTDPAPDVRLLELGSDGNLFAIRFWLSRFERDIDCRDEVLTLIERALRRGKVAPPRLQVELNQSLGLSTDPAKHETELAQVFALPPDRESIEA